MINAPCLDQEEIYLNASREKLLPEIKIGDIVYFDAAADCRAEITILNSDPDEDDYSFTIIAGGSSAQKEMESGDGESDPGRGM